MVCSAHARDRQLTQPETPIIKPVGGADHPGTRAGASGHAGRLGIEVQQAMVCDRFFLSCEHGFDQRGCGQAAAPKP